MLDEVDLVDVAPPDRRAHRLGRRRTRRPSSSAPTGRSGPVPGTVPGTRPSRTCRGQDVVSRTDGCAAAAGTARAERAPSGATARRGRSRGRGRPRAPRRPARRSRARAGTPRSAERALGRLELEHRPRRERAALRKSTPSPRSSTCVRSSAEWISRPASSGSITFIGKKPYATVPKASRSQCESVPWRSRDGARVAPGSVVASHAAMASQSGVSSGERVPPQRSIVSSS